MTNGSMLSNFFPRSAKKSRTPDNVRIYAIGDIHGCLGLLDQLLDRIEKDIGTTSAAPWLVFLGDYIDRGPDSLGVVSRLITLRSEKPNTCFLMGNHEQALLSFLSSPEQNEDWLHWGGDATLESYGVSGVWRRGMTELATDLRSKLPQDHVNFFKNLELSKIVGDYFFTHAGIKPGVPIDDQKASDLLWIRQEFHNMPRSLRPDQTIVHGHHPIKKPYDAGWRIAVDTGAFFSGKLSAVVLDGNNRRFIST